MASPSSKRAAKSGLALDAQNKLLEKYDIEEAQKVMNWVSQLVPSSNVPTDGEASKIAVALHDGTILICLANALQPGAIPTKYQTPAKLDFKKMEAIKFFIDFCRSYGVSDHDLFQTVDLYEEQNMVQVICCLSSLARKALQKGQMGFGPKESTKNERQFSEDIINQSKSALPLASSGTNKGASQAGMNFGNRRHVTDDKKI